MKIKSFAKCLGSILVLAAILVALMGANSLPSQKQVAFAEEVPQAATKRTTPLDLKNASTTQNVQEGWAWNNETKTLTITNINFESAGADGVLSLPKNSTIICTEGSVNNIKSSVNNGYAVVIDAYNDDEEDLLTIKGNATLNLTTPDVSADIAATMSARGMFLTNLTINKTKVNITLGNMRNTSSNSGAKATITGINGFARVEKTNITLKGGANLKISIGEATATGGGYVYGIEASNVYIYGGKLDISVDSPVRDLLKYGTWVKGYRDNIIKNNTTSVKDQTKIYENQATLIEDSDLCEVVGGTQFTPEGTENEVYVYVSETTPLTVQLKELPSGKPFKNWTLTANGIAQTKTGNSFSFDAQKDINYTITINFAVKVAVSFQTNGGSAIAGIEVDEDSKLAVPTPPTKDGFEFGGWFKDADLTAQWNFESDTATDGTILYAKWNEIPAGDLPVGDLPTGGLSAGAMIGIILGGAVVLLLAAYVLLFFVFYQNKKLSGKFWDALFTPMNKLFAKKNTNIQE